MALVIMGPQLLAILEAKRTLFNMQGQLMFLYINDRLPVWDDTTADFTPANYDGASGQNVNWANAAILDGNGGAYMLGDSCIFTPTGVTVPNEVYGYFVVRLSDLQLVFAERFAGAPLEIGANLNPFTVVPRFVEISVP